MLDSISKAAIWRSYRFKTQLYCVKIQHLNTKEVKFEFLDYGYPIKAMAHAGGNPGMRNQVEFKGITYKTSTLYFDNLWIILESSPVD